MKLLPNEDEQKTVTMMQNYRLQGLTLQAICELLHQHSIRTKQGKDKWYPNTIKRLLQSV